MLDRLEASIEEQGPPPEEVRALVARIVRSEGFRRAARLRELLQYIVDQKLSNCPREATEIRIGFRVFGRQEGYNPAEDSIVRSQARILRQRLEAYFAGEGVAEPYVLELPKGGYVPSIHPRGNTPAPETRMRRFPVWALVAGACLLTAIVTLAVSHAVFSRPAPERGSRSDGLGLTLQSADVRLAKRFQQAHDRALSYRYRGDAIGSWYDAADGQRTGFCVRNLAHQSSAAVVLGLSRETRSMISRFISSTAASRDWTGFWGIRPDGTPWSEYRNDRDFFYCLPANFDILQACLREFLWTADATYLSPRFLAYYSRSVDDFVKAWDRNGDGIMESALSNAGRGLPTYYSQQPRPLVAADLVAAQYAGYRSYARFLELTSGETNPTAAEMHRRAAALKERFNRDWWNAEDQKYFTAILKDGRYHSDYISEGCIFPLLFGLTEQGVKTQKALDWLVAHRPMNPQGLSYLPEILFRYGRNADAYHVLKDLIDPDYGTLPEVPFAVISSVVHGLMGISPKASALLVETHPHLPPELEWVRLRNVPIGDNLITLRHDTNTASQFTNERGPAVMWQAHFPVPYGKEPELFVDDEQVKPAAGTDEWGNRVLTVNISVAAGQTRVARIQL